MVINSTKCSIIYILFEIKILVKMKICVQNAKNLNIILLIIILDCVYVSRVLSTIAIQKHVKNVTCTRINAISVALLTQN